VKGQSVVGIVGERSNLILMVVFCYRIVGSMPTLLYNSDVSVATLVAMMNLEVAKYGKVVGTNKGGGGGKKRKAKSIRKRYFVIQRRLRQC